MSTSIKSAGLSVYPRSKKIKLLTSISGWDIKNVDENGTPSTGIGITGVKFIVIIPCFSVTTMGVMGATAVTTKRAFVIFNFLILALLVTVKFPTSKDISSGSGGGKGLTGIRGVVLVK